VSGAYIFLGPTLTVDRARTELDAVYLPPAAEGAIYQLRHRRPRAIGIVDGTLNHADAVSPKEILWAMEQGIHVFGGAALGALRAAELASFGMRGVGWVYESFASGVLDRDDEIAVAEHSESMVNIRRTLQQANYEEIITAATLAIIVTAGERTFYRNRTWPSLLETGRAAGADRDELKRFLAWLPAGRVDQQADDAAAMLREMRGFLGTNPGRLLVPWTMARTTEWEDVKNRAGTLPRSEVPLAGLLHEIRLLGQDRFTAARDRALLRCFATDVAEREGFAPPAEILEDAIVEFRIENGLTRGTDFARFLADNDLPADEFERLIAIAEKVRWACARAERDALAGLLDDLDMRGEYTRLAARAAAMPDGSEKAHDD
jgi:hypothetical protein